jgi:competence ComEA-like helix-hairpin-helix protein
MQSSQRRGLTVLLTILILILSIRLTLNRAIVPNPQPPEGPKADELANRIDPNTATQAELAEIPELGEKRAESIVEYRRQYLTHNPNRAPFNSPSDLERIPGIGPATVETMAPYLEFPKSQSKPGELAPQGKLTK